MTDYEIRVLAYEAGFPFLGENYDLLPHFAELVMRAERESIAQDCERMLNNRLGHLIPDRIRLRGEP
jgi:hypothetical protein